MTSRPARLEHVRTMPCGDGRQLAAKCAQPVSDTVIASPRRTPSQWLALGCLALLAVYQRSLSPLLGPRCRFYPSCSHYAASCLRTYPLGMALRRTALRLLRCQPFHPGGIDLP